MKPLLPIFLLFLCFTGRAQESSDLVSSITTIESCNEQQNCLTVTNSSYLYYDESKNEFFLKVDFGDFRLGADTNDNWLNRIQDTIFYFKALFPKEQFPALSDKANKIYKVSGQIFYNNTWRDQPIEISVYSTENSILSGSSPNNNFRYDNYKVTFSLPFVPKDFKAYKKLYYNSQTVNITVTLGRINLLKQGMEFLLKDVYESSR